MSAGDNYPKAAEKHLDDARVLLTRGRFDGAGYLAGYSVECVLKTLIEVEHKGVPQIHDLSKLSLKASQLAAQQAQRTARYIKTPDVTSLQYGRPGGWEETLRYSPPGTVSQADAGAWVAEAERLHREVIVQMRLDGVI